MKYILCVFDVIFFFGGGGGQLNEVYVYFNMYVKLMYVMIKFKDYRLIFDYEIG